VGATEASLSLVAQRLAAGRTGSRVLKLVLRPGLVRIAVADVAERDQLNLLVAALAAFHDSSIERAEFTCLNATILLSPAPHFGRNSGWPTIRLVVEIGTLTGRVETDTVLAGSTTGQVTVASGVHLTVAGAIAGPLEIEAGAEVEVHGAITAPVRNRGRLVVRGVVLSEIVDLDGGETVIDPSEVRVHEVDEHPRAAHARRSNESLSGPLTISEDLVLNGSVSGPVTVARGIFLQMNGSLAGELIVEEDAEVRIHGSVQGRITNSGRVDVYGLLHGTMDDQPTGRSEIHEGELL
jgi:hypothetical protein